MPLDNARPSLPFTTTPVRRILPKLDARDLIVTPRGYALVLTSDVGPVPVVTVEMAGKWHELFVVHPDGRVHAVDFFHALGSGGFVDHVPRPRALEDFAEAHGYVVDDVALDLVTGRWEREVIDTAGA